MREPFLGQPVFCNNNSQWAGYILDWSCDSITIWNYIEGKEDVYSLVEFKKNFTTKPPKGEPIYLSGAGPNGEPLQIGVVPKSEPAPKIEKRGRLDTLQGLTEQGAQWEITTEELTNWFRVRAEDHVKVFNNIRQAIDWIINEICEKGI